MTKLYLSMIGIFCLLLNANAQFAPQVGQPGTTAIHKDSSIFINWATGCELQLGWQNIADTTLGKAQVGDASYVTGKAGNGVASLGDGGIAILTFKHPIINGNGYDFAVFENGFIDQTLAPGTAFLELAFVEVSSDGIHYFRFPATCLNDTTAQIASFEGIFAEKIHNLAGKYLGNYGTPFDLEELKDTPGLNVNHITHVKIIDVVGSIDDRYATHDAHGNKINDPWPTGFAQSGFDIDAVGVIHQDLSQHVNTLFATKQFELFPNPAGANQQVYINHQHITGIKLMDLTGKTVDAQSLVYATDGCSFEIEQPGYYVIELQTAAGMQHQRLIVR